MPTESEAEEPQLTRDDRSSERDGTADSSNIETKRNQLYEMCFRELRAQYINYQKYYFAATTLGRRGRWLNYLTTFVGGATIFALAMTSYPVLTDIVAPVLTVALAGLSFTNVLANRQEKSLQCYKAGQKHQALYKEVEYFFRVELPNLSNDVDDLADRFQELVDEKNELNQSTAQLESRWYKKMDEVDWEMPDLEESAYLDDEAK